MTEIPPLTEGKLMSGELTVEYPDHTERVPVFVFGREDDEAAIALQDDHPELGEQHSAAWMPCDSVEVFETAELPEAVEPPENAAV